MGGVSGGYLKKQEMELCGIFVEVCPMKLDLDLSVDLKIHF